MEFTYISVSVLEGVKKIFLAFQSDLKTKNTIKSGLENKIHSDFKQSYIKKLMFVCQCKK